MLMLMLCWLALGACALCACVAAGRSDRRAAKMAAVHFVSEEWIQDKAA